MGYFPEYAPFYPDLRVGGYLRFVARMKRIPRAERDIAVVRALKAAGLEHVAERRIGTLSKGYRQRVGIAQALCGDPPILILDEPTIGLDPGQVVEIREFVGGLKGTRTVLFSSHILSEVEALCERVIVIAHGRVVGEGSPAQLHDRLGRRQRVRLRTDGPAAAVQAVLRSLPAVQTVSVEGEVLLLDAGAGDVARAIGEAMRANAWAVLELHQEAVDLEDVFIQLTAQDAPPR